MPLRTFADRALLMHDRDAGSVRDRTVLRRPWLLLSVAALLQITVFGRLLLEFDFL